MTCHTVFISRKIIGKTVRLVFARLKQILAIGAKFDLTAVFKRKTKLAADILISTAAAVLFYFLRKL